MLRIVFSSVLGVLIAGGACQAFGAEFGRFELRNWMSGGGCAVQTTCPTGLQCPMPDCCPPGCNAADPCACGFGTHSNCHACGGGLFGFGLLNGPSDGSDPFSVWLWGAPTYAGPFGFSEGVNIGYRLTDYFGLYGAIGLNHQDRGTQILGTVGVQKFGNPQGVGLLERASVWVMWDLGAYLTTPVEPLIFGVYQHQFRFMVGYMTGYYNEVGVAWSLSTSGADLAAGALSPLGGPGYLTSAGTFVGPYLKRRVGQTDLTGTIGYSQGASGIALGIGAERPVTERANVYVDFKAGEGGNYAGSVGMAVAFGAADTKWY